ncbi:hypothetical protein V8C37DRAFT_376762 [Trichoderma ceciliae]
MEAERKAMQRQRYRLWQNRRGSRSISSHHAATSPRAVNKTGNTMNLAGRMAIPPYSGYNILDWHIYNRLRSLWRSESKSWSQGERRDFATWVPRTRITERENTIMDHKLAVYMRRNRPNWGHFVILRSMFGASQCARQSWWANFKGKYERAPEDAPPGIVPMNVEEVLRTNRMEPPPITNIPTMEVKENQVEGDCRCSWCLKNPDKAGRGHVSASQELGTSAKAEPQLGYPRGQSIFTGEGETCEDRARRFERAQGVEPEEAQDDEWAEFVARASSLREMSTLVSAEVSIESLRDIVVEQGSLMETLVGLMEKQHKSMQRLAAKVDKGAEEERAVL